MAKQGWISGSARATGGSRNYKLWVPRSLAKDEPAPLLMVLHGCTHNADDMAEISGMNQVADANRFLVVYPEQAFLSNPMKCWNWFDPQHQSRDAGEPAIFAAIVEQVRSRHALNADRTYVAAVSAGGAMAVIAAATYPDLFVGLAVSAGAEFKAATSVLGGLEVMKRGGPDPTQQGEAAFEAMQPGLQRKKRGRMPVIVFHGGADDRVAPVNAEQVIAQWSATNARLAAHNGEKDFAVSEKTLDGQVPSGRRYRQRLYHDQRDALLMESWLVEGPGHAWSGSPRALKYGDPGGPKASEEIWRFFTATSNSPLVAALPFDWQTKLTETGS